MPYNPQTLAGVAKEASATRNSLALSTRKALMRLESLGVSSQERPEIKHEITLLRDALAHLVVPPHEKEIRWSPEEKALIQAIQELREEDQQAGAG